MGKRSRHALVSILIFCVAAMMISAPTLASSYNSPIIEAPGQVDLSQVTSFQIIVSNIEASKVFFPTWTLENGQDDLFWYEGVKAGNDRWQVTIPLSKHNLEIGTYTTHIYKEAADGNRDMIGIVNVEVYDGGRKTPLVYTQSEADIAEGFYDIIITNVYSSEVRFPTWTEQNGQDDLIWYKGAYLGNGKWKISIPLANHNRELGRYITHIYKVDADDQSTIIGWVNVNVVKKRTDLFIHAPQIVWVTDFSFDIYLSNVQAKKVEFPTWTLANGQDDLIWYQGTHLGEGYWKVTIDLTRHRKEAGVYTTHIYKFDSSGTSTMIGSINVNVIDTPFINYPLHDIGIGEEQYEVRLSNVEADKVTFPTWTSANGQGDLIWHDGVNLGKGNWKVTIPFSKHNDEAGTYITHVYKYVSGREKQFIGEFGVNVVDTPSVIAPQNVNANENEIVIRLLNVKAAKVYFPTWTEANGQDDIVWYEGVNLGRGKWEVKIPLTKHNKQLGTYITHIYKADLSGQRTFVTSSTTNVVLSENQSYYQYDGLGRLKHINQPDGQTLQYEYDQNGNVLRTVSRKGEGSK
ncbi:GBS Bsp-like repeat-containing protein [Paenibacillus sp. MSJ-34]|uniref:GBS Bsp-like repeat-containing protein n=1 Tax=Paenibacillus sp. MSJ-34 TaxID=2841529 RepID=UPI001C1123E4|nr:GBS Bsp-like repeat-containing protein [Paenibacillus sp. MSJ-34]MBU5445556.1 GBS Bsp-like repeat-containing protein [Paenibacillus sp. MSJ-34]